MKLVLKPALAKSGRAPNHMTMTKAEIPTLVEQLLKSFADRLPPQPR